MDAFLKKSELDFFHTTQQGMQTILPAVLLFFQVVVLTLQLFTLLLCRLKEQQNGWQDRLHALLGRMEEV